MLVPTEIRNKVDQKIQDWIDVATQRYDRTYTFPKIVYTTKGAAAGWAMTSQNLINLNPILLMENQMDCIEQTVVHEFAHIVDAIINRENHESSHDCFTGRRTKRSIHGATWKNIMVLFGVNPSRCHSYDMTTIAAKNTREKYEYVCGCGEKMTLGAKRHAKQVFAAKVGRRQRYYIRGHSKCKFVLVDGGENRMVVAVRKVLPNPTTKVSESKLDRCRIMFQSNSSRKHNIFLFVQVGCTPAGAATYYAKIKKEG